MVRRPSRSVPLAFLTPVLVAAFVLSHGDAVPTQSQPLPAYGILEFATLGGASVFDDIQ